MQKYSILLLLCYVLSTSFGNAQNADNFNGLSVTTGNLHPTAQNYGISLDKELLTIHRLDSVVKYDAMYEFRNTTQSFCTVSAEIPVNVYFNEFAYGKRTSMLDKLATIPSFSDLFTVDDRAKDMRDQIRKNFQQRLFVRKYVSVDNLKEIGINIGMFRNGEQVNIKKILCQIQFKDATPLYLPKNTEVLAMEISFMVDLNFSPGEQSTVMIFTTVPGTVAGIGEDQAFTLYEMGYEKNWQGPVSDLYIEHDLLEEAPIFPKKFNNYTASMSGLRDQVLKFSNYTPAQNDMIGFYHISNTQDCNGAHTLNEQLFVPSAIKNITASSWVKSDLDIPNRYYVPTPQMGIADTFPFYQTGNPTNLDIFNERFQEIMYNNAGLYDLVSMKCKNNAPSIHLKESGNPVFAFDLADWIIDDTSYSDKPNLGRNTCWCEDASGPGVGEWIEFELTQPAKAMNIYNGNQLNKKVFDESSKADIIVIKNMDGNVITTKDEKSESRTSIIDLTILNVYQLNLVPGKYRISIDAVDKGAVSTTCLTSIYFDFIYEDEWYQQMHALIASYLTKTGK
ncbi:MAG: hypothetical protein R2794_06140 [Chitinophagales bacterium]